MKLIILAATAVFGTASLAQAQELTEIDKPASELEQVLADEAELSAGTQEIRVVRVMIEPQTAASWHTHPSPVYVYVTEGELSLEVGEETKTIKAGEAVAEPLDVRMRALNTTDKPARAVVFQISPKEKAFLEEDTQNQASSNPGNKKGP